VPHLLGGLATYAASRAIDIGFLVAFAAGNPLPGLRRRARAQVWAMCGVLGA